METAFTPSVENKEIRFDLKPKATGGKKPKGGGEPAGGSTGSGSGKPSGGEGLKIPDLFKNN